MRLLFVIHSRSGSTRELADAALDAARRAAAELASGSDSGIELEIVAAAPSEVGPDDLRDADGYVVATSEHFGAMAGLVKDLFERTYYEVIDDTRGRPYALIVKGNHDGQGTVRGLTAIATGLGWKPAQAPLVVIGEVTDADRAAAAELGGSMAAGLALGLF